MASGSGDQSYAVLTIVALLGPASAYDIERFLERLAAEFWSAPHTQVYRECAALEGAGLLRAKQEKTGRKRRVYSLTKKGRDEVTDWIRTPTGRSIEIRDISHLKLLASELSTTEDIRALAEAQVASYEARLQNLSEIEERYHSRPELGLRMQSVAMGRGVYQAALDFWTKIAKNPPAVGGR
jgi:DNA-binding PadR family transcriptional regulator